MKKPKETYVHITPTDLSAISAALPLVLAYQAETPAQQSTNVALAASVSEKISSGNLLFSPEEQRIITFAVYSAQQYLAGHLPGVFPGLTDDEVSDLRRNLFSYNRLVSIFGGPIG